MPRLDFDHVRGQQQAGCDLLAKRLLERRHHGGAVYAQRDLVTARAASLAVHVARRHVFKLREGDAGVGDERRRESRHRESGHHGSSPRQVGGWFGDGHGFPHPRSLPLPACGEREQRRRAAANAYCGSANTYTALPPVTVSASGVTRRAATLDPPPAAMATYWRPFTEYVTVKPKACDASRVCHRILPSSAS